MRTCWSAGINWWGSLGSLIFYTPASPFTWTRGESPKVVERHVLLSDQRQGHKFLLIAFLRAEMVVFIIPGNQMCAILWPRATPQSIGVKIRQNNFTLLSFRMLVQILKLRKHEKFFSVFVFSKIKTLWSQAPVTQDFEKKYSSGCSFPLCWINASGIDTYSNSRQRKLKLRR